MLKILYILVNDELYLKVKRYTFIVARMFWNASEANYSEFQPCFWLAKSTVGLETVFHVFLGKEHIFQRQNYMAFVH